jgi:mono/diheme cytochrome c family protein
MRFAPVLMLCLGTVSPTLWAADADAGKQLAQAKCASCHEPGDWQGETTGSLESLIKDVVSGKIKHGKAKVELSAAEIADITAYWLTGKK